MGIAVIGEPPAAGKIAVIPRQADREPAIRQQLSHMLKSKVFVQSERLSRFLQFIVEQVLGGNQSQLKEYVIGSRCTIANPRITQATIRLSAPSTPPAQQAQGILRNRRQGRLGLRLPASRQLHPGLSI